MRTAIKYFPVILLGSLLGGCSMAGTGDYFADEYVGLQRQQMPDYYGESAPSAPSGCMAPTPCQQQSFGQLQNLGQPATPNSHAYGTSVPGYGQQQGYGQQPTYGQPAYGQSDYGYPSYGAQPYANASYGRNNRGLRQSYKYGEFGATVYDVDSDLFGALGRVGYQSKSVLGAELEATLGATSTTRDTGTLHQSLKVKYSLAGFGVARVPVSEKINVLARAGYHKTELRHDFSGTNIKAGTNIYSTDGLAFGLGAEYAMSPRTSLRGDYTVHDYDGSSVDSFALAVSRKF